MVEFENELCFWLYARMNRRKVRCYRTVGFSRALNTRSDKVKLQTGLVCRVFGGQSSCVKRNFVYRGC